MIDKDSPLSAWLKNHTGYFLTWKHDPSIQSMLVMLDALHKTLGKADLGFQDAWERLSDTKQTAIRFHVLLMKENGLTDKLYITMNSRGKPLTEFENFKANFEGMLKKQHPKKANDFIQKIDNEWADIFWEYKDDKCQIDKQFMRYFRFVTDVCAWRNGIFSTAKFIDEMADDVYENADEKCIDFLLHAFDVWHNSNGNQTNFVRVIFDNLFTTDKASLKSLFLFNTPGTEKSVDFFGACCQDYKSNSWSYGNTLLFYAVLRWKIAVRFEQMSDDYPKLSKRLRVVRNLIEASNDELALREGDSVQRITNLLCDVEKIILHGDIRSLSSPGFNKVQIDDEIRKEDFLLQNPALEQDLHALEDHALLQGGLSVFTLQSSSFQAYSKAFQTLFDKARWPDLTGALLSKGEYARKWSRGNGAYLSFGSAKNAQPWQNLFRGRRNDNPHPANDALMRLLDDFCKSSCNLSALVTIQNEYLNNPNTDKDWRYYFVKYPIMRDAPRGNYVFEASRYRACMLKSDRVATFRDPYLCALVEAAGYSNATEHFSPPSWPREFYGNQDEHGRRIIKLQKTGIMIECVKDGWQLSGLPIANAQQQSAFMHICICFSIGTDWLLRTVRPGSDFDYVDRVDKGAKLLKELISKV